MNFELNIPSRIYTGDVNKNELLVYIYLKAIYTSLKNLGEVYIPNDLLIQYMFGNNPTRREKELIVDSINLLQDKKYIAFTNNKFELLDVTDSYFVIVPFSSINKIMKSNESKKADLCLYFLQLMSTRNNSLKVGYQKISYLSSITGLSEKTIMRNNAKLESLEVIYMRRSYSLNTKDGFTYSDNNVYGLIEDKDVIDKYADSKDYGNDRHDSNWQRKVTGKYNAYCKSPSSYTYGQMEEIYNMCIEYNRLMDELQKNRQGDDYIKKKKDMGVFNVLDDNDLF